MSEVARVRRLAVTVVDEEADRRLRRANIEALLERRALRRQVEREEARADIEHLVRALAKIAAHLAPAMPRTAAAISASVRSNKKPENLFPRI